MDTKLIEDVIERGWNNAAKRRHREMTQYKVELVDLSGYPEGTVLVTDAPVWATIECATFEEAFGVVLDYSEIFQCSIITPDTKE
jgi:hypothetical protein